MKKTVIPFVILMTFFLSAFSFVAATNWTIGTGYQIKFTSNDPSGVFTSLKGDILFDESDLSGSKFNVIIDAASINTGNGMKNGHAKSDKFFDVKKYPNITFISSRIEKGAAGYSVTGTLDMHGVKKEITFPFKFSNNTFVASFDIKRTDYNLGGTTGMMGHAATTLKVDVSVPVTK